MAETQIKEHNKATTLVGLEFNVQPFKTWLKSFYDNQTSDKEERVKIMNAHYMLATTDQVMIFNLITGCSNLFEKTNNGLVDITLDKFQSYILTTPYLRYSLERFFTTYVTDMDYSKQVCVDRKSFNRFIETRCFHQNKNISFNKETLNFLLYLVAQVNITLANSARIFAKFAKRSTVSAAGIISGAELLFQGKLLQDILGKVDDVQNNLKNKDKADSEKGGDAEVDAKSSKSKSSKSDSKSKSKSSKDEDSASESESEAEAEEEASSSDEEEPPAKVVSKKTTEPKTETKNKTSTKSKK
jgi:hypothetical protein